MLFFLTFKTLFNRSLPGWLQIFLLLTTLRLNSCSSSKTNLPKYTTLHLTPLTLLKILVSSLTNILPFLSKFYLSPKPITTAFINFAVSGLTLILQLPVPLLPMSVILSTMNSLSLNYPISSRSRIPLLILSLKLLSPVISLPYCTLSIGSESPNASNTSSSHLFTKFLRPPNLHSFITSSLFSVLAILAFHPLLLLLGHWHHPV